MRKIVFLIFVLLAATSWAAYGFLTGGGQEPLPKILTSPLEIFGENRGTSKNIMVMGVDSRPSEDDPGRSDTLFVVLMDKNDDDVCMISVPRDTRVHMKGLGWDKINHAFSFGGEKLTRTAVEHLLGLKVDNYVSVDFKGFKDLVDAIGGVDIEVEKRMYYRDSWDGFTIDLAPGMQHMDGETAIQYVRFRDEEGDLGRVRRQQRFMSAVYQKAASPAIILHLPALIKQLYAMVETDMSIPEMVDVGASFAYRTKHKNQETKAQEKDAAKKNDAAASDENDTDENDGDYADEFVANSLGFKAAMVPGTPKYVDGISFWIPDVSRLRKMMASVLGDQSIPAELQEGTAELELQYERAMVDPLNEDITGAELRGEIPEKPEVRRHEKTGRKKKEEKSSGTAGNAKMKNEKSSLRTNRARQGRPTGRPVALLQNGSGNSSAASSAEARLEQAGFTVLYSGTATARERTSVTITNDRPAVNAAVSGIPFKHATYVKPSGAADCDVIVVLGEDYK